MPALPPALAGILGHLRTEPSRTGSVIVTLYGDVVAPRGGSLWVGTVLEIFAALEVGGNVVRTAMSRLAGDGWLERSRAGRNSYYRLAEKGRATFASAARRIYGAHSPGWDGTLHLAVLAGGDRTALEEAGYAPLAPGVLLAATPTEAVDVPGVVHLRATASASDLQALARQVWGTERLLHGYERFIRAFEPLDPAGELSDLHALAARLLLIHEYRRVVLHDPLLPAALLPADWAGIRSRTLCAHLYRQLLPGSERWLDTHAASENGPLPPPSVPLEGRFSLFES